METSFFQSLPFGITGLVIVGTSWALTGLIAGAAPKHQVPISVVQKLGAVFSVVAGLVIMACTGQYPHASASAMTLAVVLYILTGVIDSIMLELMSLAMQQGPNGIIWVIIQSGTIGGFITGILFFGVVPTFVRVLGLVLLLAAMALFGLSKDNSLPPQDAQYKPLVLFGHTCGWKLLSIMAFSCVFVQQSVTSIPSYFEECRRITPIFRTLLVSIGTMGGVSIWGVLRHQPHPLLVSRECLANKYCWIYVLAIQFFRLFFAYTLLYPGMDILAKAGLGGMSYPLMVGSCIVAFVAVSVTLLKEKIRPLQILALLMCIAGLVCLCQMAA